MKFIKSLRNRSPNDEAKGGNLVILEATMASDDTLTLLHHDLEPFTIALLSIELDLGALVRIERDVLDLRAGLVVTHADPDNFFLIWHLQAALKLLVLVHSTKLLCQDT